MEAKANGVEEAWGKKKPNPKCTNRKTLVSANTHKCQQM